MEKTFLLCLISGLCTPAVWTCDEYSWEEVTKIYQECQETNDMAKYRESWACAPILTLCSESHQLEIDALLPPTDPLRRVVRSPKKRGGVSGRIRTAGKIASGIVRQRAGSRSGGSGSGITRLLGGSASKKGTSSLGGSKSKSKSKVFGKVGKYAVAGLAAYGAYKVAKKMSKGLRSEYDDDDCWEYSWLNDQYQCVCPGRCNVYIGAANALTASFLLTIISTTFAVYTCFFKRL